MIMTKKPLEESKLSPHVRNGDTEQSYNLFARRRTSKDYETNLQRQVSDEVSEKCASKKRELTQVIKLNLTTCGTTGSDQVNVVSSRTRMFTKQHLL